MQKNAPKILAILLLVVIATLMLVAGGDEILRFVGNLSANAAPDSELDNGLDPGNDIDNTNNNNNNNLNNNNNNDDDTNPDGDGLGEVEVPFEINFPKQSKESSKYLYEQAIEVEGEIEVENVFYTSKGIFIVLTSTALGGDFKVDGSTVSIVKMAFDGTLEDIKHLATNKTSKYLASQITDCGLQITVSCDEATYLFHFDEDLNSLKTIELAASRSAGIFSLSEGYILILERAENTIYLIKDCQVEGFALLMSGNTVEIVETGLKLVLFVNGVDGYNVINMDKNLEGYEIISVPSKTLLRVQPVPVSSGFCYLAAEKDNGNLILSKYTSTYRPTDESINLGRANSVKTYLNGSSVFAVLEKDSGVMMYLLDLSLDVISINGTALKDTKTIYKCLEYSDGYYLFAATETAYNLFDIRNDGIISTNSISEPARDALIIRRHSGEIILFYEAVLSETMRAVKIISLPY